MHIYREIPSLVAFNWDFLSSGHLFLHICVKSHRTILEKKKLDTYRFFYKQLKNYRIIELKEKTCKISEIQHLGSIMLSTKYST